ncbi:MAG: acyltransferase family protein [Promethearchaeota archaeon]
MSGTNFYIFFRFQFVLEILGRFFDKTFYKKGFKNILVPYAFFCFLYVIIPPIIENKPIDFSIEDFLNILFDPWNFVYHLWFIALITSFYLFYPLFVKLFIRFENSLFFVFLVSILIQIIWHLGLIFIISGLERIRDFLIIYKFCYWFFYYLFLRYISYFVLGVYINKNHFKLAAKKKFFVFSIIPIFFY